MPPEISEEGATTPSSSSSATSDNNSGSKKKPRGVENSFPGTNYQIMLLMLFAWRAKQNNFKSFNIRTEEETAGAFDDVVLSYFSEDNGNIKKHRFLQAKHKLDEKNQITYSGSTGLFNTNKDHHQGKSRTYGMFELQKYYETYRDVIKSNYKGEDIVDLVICTNINIQLEIPKKNKSKKGSHNLGEQPSLKNYLEEFSDRDAVLDLTGGKKYKLKHSTVIPELKSMTVADSVKKVVDCVVNDKYLNKLDDLVALNMIENSGFSPAFIKGHRLPKAADVFRRKLLEHAKKSNKSYKKVIFKKAMKNFKKFNLQTEAEVKEEFVKKVVFAVNYNAEELLKHVKDEMVERFCLGNSDLIADHFKVKMMELLNPRMNKPIKSKEEFDKFFEDVENLIANLYSVGPTSLYCLHIEQYMHVKKHKIQFKNTNLDNFLDSENQKQILNLICDDTKLGAIKVYQVLKSLPEYGKLDSFIFTSFVDLGLYNKLIQAFESNTANNLLVIECTDASKQISNEENDKLLYEELFKILKDDKNKKVILITRDGDAFAKKFEDDDKYATKTDGKYGLTDFEKKSQDYILNNVNVSFQGDSVKLGDVTCGSENLVDSEVLSKIVKKEEIVVGSGKEDTFMKMKVPFDYIDRKFTRGVKIEEKIKGADEFVITYNSDIKEERNKEVVLISNNETYFNELCGKNETLNIHWLDNQLEWRQSRGSINELDKFNNRKSKDAKITHENNIVKENSAVIISGEPGSGKSTVLTSLSVNEKRGNLLVWVVRINLGHSSYQLSEFGNSVGNSLDKAKSFLFQALKLKTPFEKNLLRDRLDNKGKIYLFFDAFDEICPYNKEVVIELLQILKTTKAEKLVVCTRPYGLVNALENALDTFAYEFLPFSRENQLEFLQKDWQLGTDGDKFIGLLLDTFSKSVNDFERTLVSIPLQIYMIREVFRDLAVDVSKNSCEFTFEKLNLVHLYDKFVEDKFDKILREKFRQTIQYIITNMKKKFIEDHRKMALYFFFGNDQDLLRPSYKNGSNNYNNDQVLLLRPEEFQSIVNSKNGLLEQIRNGEEKLGIVDDVVDNKPHFIHKSFAEYFAADWFAHNLASGKVFLTGKIFESGNQLIRRFFDLMLIQDGEYSLHAAVLNNADVMTVHELSKVNVNGVDNGGRTALHLAASYGYEDIADILLDSGAEFDLEDTFKWTPLRYADKNEHWDIVELLLEKGANFSSIKEAVKCVDKEVKYGNTLLHIAAENGHVNFAQILLAKGAKINSQNGNKKTPLHLAVKSRVNPLKMVQLLVKHIMEEGSNINVKDEKYKTALHLAAKRGNYEIVKCLVEGKAQIEVIDVYNRTPLHYAAAYSNHFPKILKYLLSSAERIEESELTELINAKDINGNSVLYTVCGRLFHHEVPYILNRNDRNWAVIHEKASNCNKNVVEYLIDKSEKYNNSSKCRSERFSMINFLLEHEKETNLDVLDNAINDGEVGTETSFHWAIEKSDLETVKFFLTENINAADSNDKTFLHLLTAKDKDLRTPILHAIEVGNEKVVEYLQSECENLLSNEQLESLMQEKDKNGYNLLYLAVGNIEIAKLLIESAKKINKTLVCVLISGETNHGETPLSKAKQYDEDVAEYLVKEYSECFIRADSGKQILELFNSNGFDCKALHVAMQHGNLHVLKCIVKYIKENKCCTLNDFINSVDSYDETYLHKAIKNEKVDIVKYLLSVGADVTIATKRGETTLHFAADNLRIVKQLIQVVNLRRGETELERLITGKGCARSPIHEAVKIGNKGVVEYLLKEYCKSVGLNINERLPSFMLTKYIGDNVLHLAKSKFEMIHLLIDFVKEKVPTVLKQLLNAMDIYGMTVLYQAAESGKTKVVKYFIQEFKLLAGSNEELLEFIYAKLHKKSTGLLHAASREGHVDVLKYLVGYIQKNKICAVKDFVNSTDNEGQTCLQIAVKRNRSEVVNYLLNYEKADFNVAESDDYTALHTVADNLQEVKIIIKRLKDEEVDLAEVIPAMDNDGRTPVHKAAEFINKDVVKYLLTKYSKYFLKKKYNINFQSLMLAKDKRGMSLLHLAAGNLELVKCIIEFMTSETFVTLLFDKNCDGQTPLDMADIHKNKDVKTRLFEKLESIRDTNLRMKTLLNVKAEGGNSLVDFARDVGILE